MEHKRKISVTGLGYVGLPVAVAFAKTEAVIAFDSKKARIEELKNHHDRNGECSPETLQQCHLELTSNPNDLKQADFHIIATPTPIDAANIPDLTMLEAASLQIARILKPGDIVVYESTVYPGATEEVCVPILEQYSSLRYNKDFFVGYSPERINPGDPENQFENIVKVVSGSTPNTLNIIADTYASVVQAGVHQASSIKVAEAAKVIENTQRDLNIALINELSVIFKTMQIDTHEVLAAAGTKWNFLPFQPGLVGGHCIGVDPYYLTYKAQMLGCQPDVILAGRKTNDQMGRFIAEQIIITMIQHDIPIRQAKVGIFGFTFKENCNDVRNTKVADLVESLSRYGTEVLVFDPIADSNEVQQHYGIQLCSDEAMQDLNVAIFAVKHQQFLAWSPQSIGQRLADKALLADLKNTVDAKAIKMHQPETITWRL